MHDVKTSLMYLLGKFRTKSSQWATVEPYNEVRQVLGSLFFNGITNLYICEPAELHFVYTKYISCDPYLRRNYLFTGLRMKHQLQN